MSPKLRVILLVEDDLPLRTMYRTALRMAGFYVNEAGNGLDAVRALDADPPDLVVLDLGLPLVSGYAVRAELAAQSHTRNIPVVVVTGSEPDAPLDVPCLLRKPVAPDALVAAVNKCLAAGGSTEAAAPGTGEYKTPTDGRDSSTAPFRSKT